LRETIQLEEAPSSSATGDWLKREAERGGIEGMEKINDEVTKEVLKLNEGNEYTLIIDPIIIEAEKRDAKMTYLGFKGYMPVVATIKELGLVISHEFKKGNDSGGRLEAVKKAASKMPKGKKIKEIILDAEYYSSEVIEYLGAQGIHGP
jgi:hypothetical protein